MIPIWGAVDVACTVDEFGRLFVYPMTERGLAEIRDTLVELFRQRMVGLENASLEFQEGRAAMWFPAEVADAAWEIFRQDSLKWGWSIARTSLFSLAS